MLQAFSLKNIGKMKAKNVRKTVKVLNAHMNLKNVVEHHGLIMYQVEEDTV